MMRDFGAMEEGSWLFFQYMSYLARVMEMDDFAGLWGMEMGEMVMCASWVVGAWLSDMLAAVGVMGNGFRFDKEKLLYKVYKLFKVQTPSL